MSRPDHNSLNASLLARMPSDVQFDKTAIALDLVRKASPCGPPRRIALPSARRAAVLRCAASQRATDSVHVHIRLRLFAAQSTPFRRHEIVERGKVQRAETIGKLIAERVTFRLGRARSACARRSLDEGTHAPSCARFRENRSEAIREGGDQFGEQAPRVSGGTFESGCERRDSARPLLLGRAAEADLFPVRATAPHAGLKPFHDDDGDVQQGCEQHGSSAGTDAGPCGRSR